MATWGILKILFAGIGGILLVISIKISDINSANPNLTYLRAVGLFFTKAQGSYVTSIIALLLYAFTHDEWGKLFIEGDGNTTGLVHRMINLQVLMGFFVAGGVQYGVHKLFLKKIDGIMKLWSGGNKTGSVDLETQTIQPDVEKAKAAEEKKD